MGAESEHTHCRMLYNYVAIKYTIDERGWTKDRRGWTKTLPGHRRDVAPKKSEIEFDFLISRKRKKVILLM